MHIQFMIVRRALIKDRFFLTADGEACRMFQDMVANAETPYGKHPADFTLMRLGTWDDQTGEYFSEIISKLFTGLEAVSANRKVDPGQLELLEREAKEITGNGEQRHSG